MFRRQIAASLIMGAAVMCPVTPAGADGEAVAPAFRVEQKAIDLGDVTAGQEKRAVFTFHNDGDGDVRILRAKPS